MTGLRLGFRDLASAGRAAVSKYTGTLLTVFVTQTVVAIGCMFGVAFVLAQAFAHYPMFDEAVDGDLVAIIHCLRWGASPFLAVGGIVVGALLIWQLVSWFVVGGIHGVFALRPEGRADTARVFGASGAATYLMYARLAILSIPGWFITIVVLGAGLNMATPRIEYALTLPQVIVPLVAALLPAALVLHFFWTVADYARVELTLRHESHGIGVASAYFRTFGYVVRRPVTLLHGAVGWVLIAAGTLAYAYLAQGHPMYGADGALVLFCVRQGVALVRMTIRFGVLAGQLELGRTRVPPPRPEPEVVTRA